MNVSLINRKFSIGIEEGKKSKLQSQDIFRPEHFVVVGCVARPFT